MLIDARYVAGVLYETLVSHNGEIEETWDPGTFRKLTGLELETRGDLETFERALAFLEETGVAKGGVYGCMFVLALATMPPRDDWNILPWDRAWNTRHPVPPRIIAEINELAGE